ncbi:MAG: DUF2905 domain-containing protein [Chloroflexi bacterium]|nr:DUF2905 domain-containing protein [Chloroflexota bacterium]
MQDLARLFILLGIVILGIGLILLLASRLPFLGHLPGDIRIQTDGFSCFVPLATSLVLSILLSLLLTIIGNLLQRR